MKGVADEKGKGQRSLAPMTMVCQGSPEETEPIYIYTNRTNRTHMRIMYTFFTYSSLRKSYL